MRRLGISVYPERSTKEKDFAYMKLASTYGFTRLFTCLLSVDKPKEEMMAEFKEYMDQAHELGFIVSVDTNPEVFGHLGASPVNLKPFADMKVDIVRLDNSFGSALDILATQNPYGLKIEFNGSGSYENVEAMLKYGARRDQMMICHNFYPQKYTGLGFKPFMERSKIWHDLGLNTAAFVSSNNKNTFGPWEVYAGLPTMEMHRHLPIDVQARHLFSTGLIDDVIIGNAYASKEELEALSRIDVNFTSMKIVEESDIGEEEKKIIYEFNHNWRMDYSDYMVRSASPRLAYRDISIPVRKVNKEYFEKGDVCIINDNLKHYRGELQIVLSPIPNDGERNLVGHIKEDEIIILDQVKPSERFKLIK